MTSIITLTWRRWQEQRQCFHHDRWTGVSWIADELIDLGRRKRFWCVMCEKQWFT